MSSVFNTALVFTSPYSGNYVVPGGYRYYWSWDAVVLYGAGVNFSDQQHNNNNGRNYVSYRVNRVRLDAVLNITVQNYAQGQNGEFKLTVVIYKCPAKYENGNLVPIKTKGFVNLENYILYSDPGSIVAWGVFPDLYRTTTLSRCAFNVSLSCNKPFDLGPNDVLCCNFFVDRSFEKVQIHGFATPAATAKVVFDIN